MSITEVSYGERSSGRHRRFSEIDLIKAVAILTVIVIHTIRPEWAASVSPAEVGLNALTGFAVPMFMAVSGFLYATGERTTIATIYKRLKRIVVPYLVFSLAGQVFLYWQQAPSPTPLWRDLAQATTFGHYYYVFVAVELVFAAWATSFVPRRWLWGILAIELVFQYIFQILDPLMYFRPVYSPLGRFEPLSPFWFLRNPLRYLAYFQVGWLFRLHYASVKKVATENCRLLATATLIVVVASSSAALGHPASIYARVAAWLQIYTLMALLFVVDVCRRSKVQVNFSTLGSRIIRKLSECAYTIYLAHIFFILLAKSWWEPAIGRFDWSVFGLTWLTAFLGSIAVIALAKSLSPKHSRLWFGC